jgi:hypothetical protein
MKKQLSARAGQYTITHLYFPHSLPLNFALCKRGRTTPEILMLARDVYTATEVVEQMKQYRKYVNHMGQLEVRIHMNLTRTW